MSLKIMYLGHLLFFFLSNDIHSLQTTLISTKYDPKNTNNNIKLNSTSTEPYIQGNKVAKQISISKSISNILQSIVLLTRVFYCISKYICN